MGVILMVGLPLGESVDFCEANDYGNDSAQIQDAVLNLEGSSLTPNKFG